MNKTKIKTEQYVAPTMDEHVLMVNGRILDMSPCSIGGEIEGETGIEGL